jgi:hypothetical protein
LAVAVQTAAQLANTFVLDHRRPALDAAGDWNVFGWMSFGATLLAALALLPLVVVSASVGRRLAGGLLAIFLAFLAVDDLTDLHDHLGSSVSRHLPEPLDRLGVWSSPLLYLPLLAATFGLLWCCANRMRKAPARQIRTGLAFLAAAIALRVLVGIIEISGLHTSDGTRAAGSAALQGAELWAWILMAAGLVAGGADLVRRSSE